MIACFIFVSVSNEQIKGPLVAIFFVGCYVLSISGYLLARGWGRGCVCVAVSVAVRMEQQRLVCVGGALHERNA